MGKLVIGTPKAICSITDEIRKKLPEGYKLISTTDIYINGLVGWTPEQCDNVLYIVDEFSFEGPVK